MEKIFSLSCANLNTYSICIYFEINNYSKFSMEVNIT